MISIVTFDNKGNILRSVRCQLNTIENQLVDDEIGYIEHEAVDDTIYYVKEGIICQRNSMSILIEGTNIYNIPDNSTIVIGTAEYAVEDNHIELTFSLPGTYAINISSPGYISYIAEVTQL